MAQWVNHLLNKIFVNPLPLPLSCEISGATYVPSTTGSYSRQAGMQADEIQLNFEIFKIGYRPVFALFYQDTASL